MMRSNIKILAVVIAILGIAVLAYVVSVGGKISFDNSNASVAPYVRLAITNQTSPTRGLKIMSGDVLHYYVYASAARNTSFALCSHYRVTDKNGWPSGNWSATNCTTNSLYNTHNTGVAEFNLKQQWAGYVLVETWVHMPNGLVSNSVKFTSASTR